MTGRHRTPSKAAAMAAVIAAVVAAGRTSKPSMPAPAPEKPRENP